MVQSSIYGPLFLLVIHDGPVFLLVVYCPVLLLVIYGPVVLLWPSLPNSYAASTKHRVNIEFSKARTGKPGQRLQTHGNSLLSLHFAARSSCSLGSSSGPSALRLLAHSAPAMESEPAAGGSWPAHSRSKKLKKITLSQAMTQVVQAVPRARADLPNIAFGSNRKERHRFQYEGGLKTRSGFIEMQNNHMKPDELRFLLEKHDLVEKVVESYQGIKPAGGHAQLVKWDVHILPNPRVMIMMLLALQRAEFEEEAKS